MISADLSNIWCRASLPQLLSQEAVLFDAHLRLGGGPEKKQGFLSFTEEERAREQTVQQAQALASVLFRPGETLAVLGGGLAVEGLRALSRLCPAAAASRVLFLEESFSALRRQELEEALEQTDYTVLVLSQTGEEAALCLTLRALRPGSAMHDGTRHLGHPVFRERSGAGGRDGSAGGAAAGGCRRNGAAVRSAKF